MKNTRAKGNKAVRRAIELHNVHGYDVARVERTGKFIKEKDCFGIGDILILHPTALPCMAQVTCNKPHVHKPYIKFAMKYEMIKCIQMVWVDRTGWKIYYYNHDGSYEAIQYDKNEESIKTSHKTAKNN